MLLLLLLPAAGPYLMLLLPSSSAGEALAGWLQTFQSKLFRRLRQTF
jgi:hypothetical protein